MAHVLTTISISTHMNSTLTTTHIRSSNLPLLSLRHHPLSTHTDSTLAITDNYRFPYSHQHFTSALRVSPSPSLLTLTDSTLTITDNYRSPYSRQHFAVALSPPPYLLTYTDCLDFHNYRQPLNSVQTSCGEALRLPEWSRVCSIPY